MKEFPEPNKVIEIDLPKLAKKSLIVTIATLLSLLLVKYILFGGITIKITLWSVIIFIVGYILLIILHEFFHLLGFRIFGGVPWNRMVVGVNLKLGIAYATTDQLMTIRAIRKALLLPFWTTGIFPAVIGLFSGNGIWIGLGALLIGGAAGDFAMLKELRKLPNDWLVKDDPKLPKLYVYEPERLSPE